MTTKSNPPAEAASLLVMQHPGMLTDAEWELVQDLFVHSGPGTPPKYPRRALVEACCYVVRTGSSWRKLPKVFPPWQDVYAHFRRWTAHNLFETMNDRLRTMWHVRQGREPPVTDLDAWIRLAGRRGL